MRDWGVGWDLESLRVQIQEMHYQEFLAHVMPLIVDSGRALVASYWASVSWDDGQLEVDLARWADDGGPQPEEHW